MSAHETFRVFLSAVSNELASLRRELARVLRRKGIDVCEQDHFHQGPGTLLEKLRDYIRTCDAVILLVGDQAGAAPTPEQVRALGPLPLYDSYCAAAKQSGATYTQWEYLFAKHFDKPTLVYFTDAGFTPEKPGNADPAQAAYREWIEQRGEHREPFATLEQLKEHVLVNPHLPNLAHRKRIYLPHVSLGTLFKGRDEMLARLQHDFAGQRPERATAITGKAVHGLGGVGKTRLAIEFAWRNELDYNALLFITADSPENLQVNLANLVGPMVLNLPQKDERDMNVRLRGVLDWLQDHPGWFLIIDNVDTPEAAKAVQAFLSELHGGQVLITSRLGHWRGLVQPLGLDVLRQADAAAYLREATLPGRVETPTDAADALELAAALDGLALALEQAAGYIAELRINFAEYLRRWNAHDQEVQTWHDELVMQYPRSVATTWQTTIDQLGAGEFALLRLLAYFAPEPVPLSVFDGEKAAAQWKSGIDLVRAEIPTIKAGAADVPNAVRLLARYNMADWDAPEKTIEVHRVVQEILRNRVPGEERQAWITASLQMVNDAFIGDPTDVRSWPVLNPLAAHAEEVARHADTADITEPTARLINQLALLYSRQIRFRDAEVLCRRVLTICEQSSGPEHPDVAISLNNLAQLLQDTNRLAEAEPLMHRALAIKVKTFGPEHPNVAISLDNLALLLKDTNRLAEAEPLMRRALAIGEKSLGPEHPNVAIRLTNFAQLLKATNRLAEAEPLMRRALAIDENTFGPEHPNVARDLNNLAQLLQDTSRLAEAEPLMRRALAIDEKSFGPGHPIVSIRLNNLAGLLRVTNRLNEAEPICRRALAIDEKSFGPEHPNVANRLNNLAGLLRATDRQAEAEPLYRRALAIDEKSFGLEHPEVAIDLNNLAGLLDATNRQAEAEPLFRRAAEIFVASLGVAHPSTQTVKDNYVILLKKMGRSDDEVRAQLAAIATPLGVVLEL